MNKKEYDLERYNNIKSDKEKYEEYKRKKKEYDKKRYEMLKLKKPEYLEEKKRKQRKKYLLDIEYRDTLTKRNKEWIKDNKYKYNEIRKKWVQKNNDKVTLYIKKYRMKKSKDIEFRLKESISASLRACIRKKSKTSIYLKKFGYNIKELMLHLEILFKDGMTWDNYGEWHIDHIIPQSYFDFKDDIQLIKCWSLNNLQPLWASENCSKGNRYVG